MKPINQEPTPASFQTLQAIVSNQDSSREELQSATEDILHYYGTIPAKVNFVIHPDFEVYAKLIVQICKHPKTDKDLIIFFEKKLQEKNPQYGKEIATVLAKAF